MKIKGTIKVVKYLPDGVRVLIATSDLSGRMELILPIKGVKFGDESPFEIELKEVDELKPTAKTPKAKDITLPPEVRDAAQREESQEGAKPEYLKTDTDETINKPVTGPDKTINYNKPEDRSDGVLNTPMYKDEK